MSEQEDKWPFCLFRVWGIGLQMVQREKEDERSSAGGCWRLRSAEWAFHDHILPDTGTHSRQRERERKLEVDSFVQEEYCTRTCLWCARLQLPNHSTSFPPASPFHPV